MDSRVLARKQETPDTVTLRLAADMIVTPGQFVMLGAPLLPPLVSSPLVSDGAVSDGASRGEASRELKRSYSVAGYGAPHRHRGDEPCADAHEGHLGHGGWVEVTIKEQNPGLFSKYAQTIAVSDAIALYGPFGRHFIWNPAAQESSERLVWIAGGTGIAPFRFMIQQAIAQSYPGHITLFFSVKTRADIIYADEIAAWTAALPNLRVHIALTRPAPEDLVDWNGLTGRVGEKALRDVLGKNLFGTRFFVCGPTSMVQDVQATLTRLGVASQHILTEKYGAIEG